MSPTRSFVAVDLSDAVLERLQAVRLTVVAGDPRWAGEKWVAPENLHITLKFLGDLDPETLLALRTALAGALDEARSFDLGLAGVRAVPQARRCSMLWARFADGAGNCTELAARVDSAAVACGLNADTRPFAAHATLVRARRPRPIARDVLAEAEAVITRPPISMSVRSATLYASTLTRSGPVYEAIDSWMLADMEKRAV